MSKFKPKEETHPLDIIPLGGLGEIGMNLMVYEYDGRMLIVDCGMTFPGPDTPGVDAVLPDCQFLIENRERIVGIMLTHGHEDHIGALPHIWPLIGFPPIFGTPMTLGILENKFREHELLGKGTMTVVRPRTTIKLAPFSVKFLQVTHSIVDGAALAITTPLGTVVHTGDFKIDHTPEDNKRTDLYSLAALGEQGLLALLSDSTNIHAQGGTLSERDIRKTFEDLFPKAKGMVVVSTFSSSIPRIRQVLDVAATRGRKVLLNGRSMLNNVQVARSLGYLKNVSDVLVDLKQFRALERRQRLVLTTGSQGEAYSGLVRIANNEHREVQVEPGDMVVLSSKFIPGNELAIRSLINALYRRGAQVIHEKVSEVHVSGHASREDLKLMLALTRPRFFMPIHGEMQHLHEHRRLAMRLGLKMEHTVVAENGHRVRLDGTSIRIMDEIVPHGRMFVDGKGFGDVGDIVLRDRRHLSNDGIVAVVLVQDQHTGKLLQGPELLTRGVIHVDENQELLDEAKAAVLEALAMGSKAMGFGDEEVASTQDLAVRALRRFFKKRLGRRPVVLPLLMEM